MEEGEGGSWHKPRSRGSGNSKGGGGGGGCKMWEVEFPNGVGMENVESLQMCVIFVTFAVE